MFMKKILIIEDEYISGMRLKHMISDIDDSFDVYGPLKSVESVVEELRSHNDYYLIIADIHLVDGLVFEAFRQIMPSSFVVFTTAYDEYAIEAFHANGIAYLLKPINIDDLSAAMNKVKLCPDSKTESIANTTRLMQDIKIYKERFLVSKGDELIPIRSKDICYFKTSGKTTLVCTNDGNNYYIAEHIFEIEDMLNPDSFFRINRQYIVNINSIARIRMSFNGKLHVRIVCCDDDDIYISKDKAVKFKEWLDS